MAAISETLYEDKWFRIATAVFTQLKEEFAEDVKVAEVVEAAERRLFGLRLEVIEVPLLKIEAAVDRNAKIAAVRCRAALDLGVGGLYGRGVRLHDGAVQWLRGWAMALKDEVVKQKAVEKARQTEHCRF